MSLGITISDLRRSSKAVSLILPFLTGPAMGAAVPDGSTSQPSTINVNQRVAFFIRGGCPYNLDKECHRNRRGRMVCRCVS